MASRTLSPARYRAVTGTALGALIVIVITGAAVRLTESGLGCSDWPTCEEDQFVADLEIHAMIEFVNRLITGFVSAAVVIAVLGSLFRQPKRSDLVWLSAGLVAGVLAQIVLGAFVVLSHLNPWLVLGHFMLSMVLIANAVVLHARAGDPDPATSASPVDRREPSQRWYRWPVTGLTLAAMFVGTLVTGAGPHSGSYEDEAIERLPIAVPTIARAHGVTVAVLVVTVLLTVWHLYRSSAPAAEQQRARLVLFALIVQACIGYIQYFNDVPVVLVAIHVMGATFTWIAVVWFHIDRSPSNEPDPQIYDIVGQHNDGQAQGAPILVQ